VKIFLYWNLYMCIWFFLFNRYMTLVDGPNEIYMIDRDNTVFHIPGLNFRRRKDLKFHIKDTLLDGVRISILTVLIAYWEPKVILIVHMLNMFILILYAGPVKAVIIISIKFYTVNQLLFACEKISRGLWEPCHCEFFSLGTKYYILNVIDRYDSIAKITLYQDSVYHRRIAK
jgi:hypothetical protein